MPTVNAQLASEKITATGGQGGLSPVLLSGSSGNVSAPSVNVNAANIGYTPLTPPKIQSDVFLASAANFSQTVFNEAVTYQEKRDQIDADMTVSNYEQWLMDQWLGYEDKESGGHVEGYKYKVGGKANDMYRGVAESANARFTSILSEASPSVRSKALLRMNSAKNKFIQRASDHNATQLEFAQQEARSVTFESAKKEAEIDPVSSWSKITNLAGSAKTQKEKILLMGEGMKSVLNTIEQQAIQSGSDVESAFKAKETFFNQYREQIPQDAENSVSSTLQQEAKALKAGRKDRYEKYIEDLQATYQHKGLNDLYQMTVGGEASIKGMGAYWDSVVKAYVNDGSSKNINDAESMVTDQYKQVFQAVMLGQGYDRAVAAWDDIKKAVVSDGMVIGGVGLVSDVDMYVKSTLYAESQKVDLQKRTNIKRGIFKKLSSAKSSTEIDMITRDLMNSNELSAEGMSFLSNTGTNIKSRIQSGIDQADNAVREVNVLELQREAKGGLTPEFENKVYNAFSQDSIKFDDVNDVLDMADKYSSDKVSTEYKRIESKINGLVDISNMVYDPLTQEVKFRDLVDPDELEEIDKSLEHLNRSPSVIKELAVQSLMKQARSWSKKEDQPIANFIPEFFLQQDEVKQNAVVRTAKSVYNALSGPAPVVYFDTDPVHEEVTYDWESRPEVKEPTYDATIQETPSRRQALQPTRISEYAISTIPETEKSRPLYQNQSTDWYLALEMIREKLPKVDLYSDAKIKEGVDRLVIDPEFLEWKRRKQESL